MKISRSLLKISTLILVIALCLCTLPLLTWATAQDACPHCGYTGEWTEWTGGNITDEALNGGHHHYRLTKASVTGSSQIKIGVASTSVFEICIDMNGNNINKTSRAFAIYGGTTVNLVNTSETESAVQGAYKAAAAGVINLDGDSNLRLYDNVHLSSTAADDAFPYNAGVVQVNSGTFTMKGGKITGRRVLNGGAVYVNTGTFNMEGGTISGGNAVMTTSADSTPEGGNVYVKSGTMTMTGGTISSGTATNGNGGNIYMNGGTLNISGGTISGGIASRAVSRNNGGGNIYAYTGVTLNINGGNITNGESTNSYGGNIFSRSNITMTAGTISGGTALNGGNVFISGYDAAKTFDFSGGLIKDGTATTGKIDTEEMVKASYDGDNVYLNSATMNVTGGRITDNDGGNAILAFTKKASIPATVNLSVAGNNETAADLNGKVYLISGAAINFDRGATQVDSDGDQIWIDQAYADAAGMEAMNNSVMGTYNTGNGQETVYADVTAEQFAAYEQALKDAGYTLYSSNSISGTSTSDSSALENTFRTYVSDDKVVTLGYHSADGRCYVICEDKAVATLPSVSEPTYEQVCDPLLTQVGSEDITLLESPPADYPQENDMCYIVRLADGTFFIIDSAETATADRIYDVLKKQAPDPENIVISGWLISHPHSDHYRGFLAFAEKYASDTTITVKEFVYNFTAYANIETAIADKQVEIVDTMKSAYPDAKHSIPHTGTVLRYADMAVTFLYTQEDYLAANNGVVCNVNGTSLVFRMVFNGGTSVFIPADHPTDGYSSGGTWCENKLEIWYGNGLKSDISSVFHHGYGGGAHKEIYYAIAPEVVLWDTDIYRFDLANGAGNSRNAYFCENNEPKNFVFLAGSNITVLNLRNGDVGLEYDGLATEYTGTALVGSPIEPVKPEEPVEPMISVCPHCGVEVEWTEWTGSNLTDAALNDGHHHYRLTKASVTGSSQIKIGAAGTSVFEICIDMNGNNINKTSRAFAVYGGTTLNLVNTSETESTVTGAYKAAAAGVINMDGSSNLRVYDGVHLASTAADDAFPYNAGVVQVNSGTFTMKGGKITGRRVLNGGAVYVNSGTFNMEGGTITGGNAVMTSSKDSSPEGGNVYVDTGIMNMSGGVIENGSAAIGGNIYVGVGGTLNITGGTIQNGTVTTTVIPGIEMVKESYDSSNICVNSGTLIISGGIISDSDGGNAILAFTTDTEQPATVTLTLNGKADTAAALDGKVYLVSGAVLTADVGTAETDDDGDQIWYNKPAESDGVLGDFTGDSLVTNDDVVYLLWHTLFNDQFPITSRGDFTGDNLVTNDDVVYLLWHTLFDEQFPLV